MNLYNLHSNPEQLHGYSTKEYRVPELAYELAKKKPELRPKLESAIAKSPELSSNYAQFIIRREFPAGEDAIAKDPLYSLAYAMMFKRRFLKGEPVIRLHARLALIYVREVIKGRWVEAEGEISKTPFYWQEYKNFLQSLK